MSITVRKSWMASSRGRWKALRPMIEPKAPPSRRPRISVRISSVPLASPPEKIYYVLSGELTVIAGGKETVAKAGDSVYIGPNESREIINRSNEVCTIAVAVAPVK